MNVELAELMTDLADETAATCVAGSCALVARADGDWHDTATLRGGAGGNEFRRALRYLQLRGRLVHHQTDLELVRIMDSGIRPATVPESAADTLAEYDLHTRGARHSFEPPYDGNDPDRNKPLAQAEARSEEHTSELQSLMRISYAVFCLK